MRNLNRLGTWALVFACGGTVALAGSTAASRTAGAATPQAAAGLAPLAGHVSGHARAQFDVGRAPDSLALDGLEIVFAKTPAQQQALETLNTAQQDPKSPQYHSWLTPAQYGARFGASATTVAAVTRWLTASGFSVDALPANRSQLRFHGSKAQVETAFHTEIHLFEVGGAQHYANVTDPQVPAGLAPAILAVQGLHDFYPRPTLRHWAAHGAGAKPQITYDGGQENWIGPGDFAAMYNLGPLYAAGVNGKGMTIAIGEQSDIDATVADTFWMGVGVTPPTITPMTVPGGTDPGQTMDSNEEEAYLDVEVAGGLAPGATIVIVSDANVGTAVQYIIQQNIGQVVSLSFSECESGNTAANNAAIDTLFNEAVTQGQTVAVASDDAGVEGCEQNTFVQGTLATTGFAVSGLASSPHALAVGGTDFDPNYTQPWNTTNAAGTLTNAQGHIPEMVWNDTCANPEYAKALATTAVAFCNEAQYNGAANPFLQVAGSGSGVSSFLAGDSTTKACTGGYAVPSWQSGVAGISGLTGRAVPDVAVAAGGWVICSYDNATCDPGAADASTNGDVDLVGGTSSSTPAVAAIIALLDQEAGAQGLINPKLYTLAAAEYGTPAAPKSATATCSASLGLTIGADCIFYDITAGSSDQPCTVATYSDTSSAPASTCGGAASGQTNGIMELSGAPQYVAGSGFNLAAGLGSINATNLVLAIYLPAPTGLTATPGGQSVQLSWTADAHAATYNVYQGAASGQEAATPVQTAVAGTSTTVSGLQYATTYYFTIAAVAALGTSQQSVEVQAMTVPTAPTGLSATSGNATASLTWTTVSGAASYNVYQGTSAGGESASPVQTGISGTTATVSGLTNGSTYYFKVAAVDAGGASALSNETSASPVAPPSGGGGGALGLAEILLLAMLAAIAAASRYGVLRGASRERTQRAMSARPMAPERRAISRPPRK